MHKLAVLFAGLLLISCAGSGIKSNSDANPNYNVADYQTFGWVGDEGNAMGNMATGRINPLVMDRIHAAIHADLVSKGFTHVANAATADFVVGYSVGTRQKTDIQTWPVNNYYGRYSSAWGRSYYGFATEVTTHTYTEAELAIDLFDVETHEPVWHAWSTKKVNFKTAGSVEEVQRVVEATLKDLPGRY